MSESTFKVERCKYAYNRREWIKRLNVEIPDLEKELIKFQLLARDMYEASQLRHQGKYFLKLRQEASDQAVKGLTRLLYFKEVYRVNYDPADYR